MHESIERLERLLTLAVLLLLGIALTNDLLGDLTLPGAVVGMLVVFVVRPLTAYLALVVRTRAESGDEAPGARPRLTRGEQLATAFFGVRGVGSLYYLAYAGGAATFPGLSEIWAAVAFTIGLSVLVHGITATPVMARLESRREACTPAAA
jgi:NhaP-type Na+/H+ or K+/H+ antiporter